MEVDNRARSVFDVWVGEKPLRQMRRFQGILKQLIRSVGATPQRIGPPRYRRIVRKSPDARHRLPFLARTSSRLALAVSGQHPSGRRLANWPAIKTKAVQTGN